MGVSDSSLASRCGCGGKAGAVGFLSSASGSAPSEHLPSARLVGMGAHRQAPLELEPQVVCVPVSAAHPPPRGRGRLPGPCPPAETHVLPKAQQSDICREPEATGDLAVSQASTLCAEDQQETLCSLPLHLCPQLAALWASVFSRFPSSYEDPP